MIRALRRWWIERQIQAAEWDAAYWTAGIHPAIDRANDYAKKAKAARARRSALSRQLSEIDYPINTRGIA